MHSTYVRTGTIDVRQFRSNQSAYQQLAIKVRGNGARMIEITSEEDEAHSIDNLEMGMALQQFRSPAPSKGLRTSLQSHFL
jgi:hypothetical protein